jgi:hypothetical protein
VSRRQVCFPRLSLLPSSSSPCRFHCSCELWAGSILAQLKFMGRFRPVQKKSKKIFSSKSVIFLAKFVSTVDVHDYFLQEIGIFFVKSFISPISVSNFSGSQSLATMAEPENL